MYIELNNEELELVSDLIKDFTYRLPGLDKRYDKEKLNIILDKLSTVPSKQTQYSDYWSCEIDSLCHLQNQTVSRIHLPQPQFVSLSNAYQAQFPFEMVDCLPTETLLSGVQDELVIEVDENALTQLRNSINTGD